MNSEQTQTSVLRAHLISKNFGATCALDKVDLQLGPAEVHAVIGENGAGKSTLMKILSGALQPDSGEIELFGNPFRPTGPLDSRRAGIATIYQELAIAPHLTVEENILLGVEPGPGIFLQRRISREKASKALETAGLASELIDRPAGQLSIGEQQLVELARAVASGFRILILDEPTSSLTSAEKDRLFRLLDSLRKQGKSIIYISHFLDEVLEIADRCTILRDGRLVETREVASSSLDSLASAMVGRSLDNLYPRSSHSPGELMLEVNQLEGGDGLKSASFSLHRGEVLGVAGLVGSGRTRLLETLFGLARMTAGSIRIGAYFGPASPVQRWRQQVGFVSEDRKGEGLALGLSIQDNVTLPRLDGLGPFGLVLPERQSAASSRWLDRLSVRYRSTRQAVLELSGGNQQKVALSRLLYHECDLLLLDEPTRGIDIGSKAEIYRLIDELAGGDAASGIQPRAVLFVSSYLPELLGVCDRIAVMSRGVMTRPEPVQDLTEEKIMRAATTVVQEVAE